MKRFNIISSHLLLPQSPDVNPSRVLAGQYQAEVLLLLQVGDPDTIAELGEGNDYQDRDNCCTWRGGGSDSAGELMTRFS